MSLISCLGLTFSIYHRVSTVKENENWHICQTLSTLTGGCFQEAQLFSDTYRLLQSEQVHQRESLYRYGCGQDTSRTRTTREGAIIQLYLQIKEFSH